MSPLLFLILLPLLGAVAIACRLPARASALAAACGCLGIVLSLARAYDVGGEFQHEWVRTWFELPMLGKVVFRLGMDGVNLPMLILTGLVSLSAFLLVPPKLEREREFYACLLVILSGAYGAFASMDLLCMYIFHEFALIPTFIMIGLWGNGYRRVYATYQMALYLLAGSLVLLVGIFALLFSLPPEVRTTDLMAIRDFVSRSPLGADAQQPAYFLLLIGFGVLVGLFPFHTWAPRGYSAAPTPVAMMHAGVLKKFGIYGMVRVVEPILPAGAAEWSSLFLVLLTCNILVVGWVAISRKNFDDMIGYSSVMHMGYLFLGIAAGTPAALTGVVLLSVAHGLSVSGLFAGQGIVRARTGQTEFDMLGGVATKMPLLGFVMTVLAMASIGLPGLANFAGEIMIFFGSWHLAMPGGGGLVPVVAALFGVVISSIYTLRAVKKVFFGPQGKYEMTGSSLALTEKTALLIPVAALVVLGFVPSLISDDAAASLSRWFGW